VVAILIGLTLWWTAFILLPAGVTLIAAGVIRSARRSPLGRSNEVR
jgi:hypothetical protein